MLFSITSLEQGGDNLNLIAISRGRVTFRPNTTEPALNDADVFTNNERQTARNPNQMPMEVMKLNFIELKTIANSPKPFTKRTKKLSVWQDLFKSFILFINSVFILSFCLHHLLIRLRVLRIQTNVNIIAF